VLAVWAALTWAFWVGYVGSDDFFYCRYAYLLHRPPINWWEFRTPYIAVLHGSFSLLGSSELAAALPTLLASLTIAASAACLATLRDWRRWASVALAITMPMDVVFRTVPGAPFFAAGLLAAGTACILRGAGRVRLLGSLLLACAFVTYEVSFFYVALLSLTALAFDPRRFAVPVLVCVALSCIAIATECATYDWVLGDPLARYRTAGDAAVNLPARYQLDTAMSATAFFLWPLRNLVVTKAFGFGLALLLVTGLLGFGSLRIEQRILWITTFLVFLWLSYGTQVPWAYRPFYRQFHYYAPITLGVASLLPAAVTSAIRRPRHAQAVVAFCLLSQLVLTGLGGRWGQRVNVSRELLAYARSRPDTWFVTDVATMNDMYVLGGFRLPQNVVCVNGPAAERHLLVNKEPAGTPTWRFPEPRIRGVLLNLEGMAEKEPEADFKELLESYPAARKRTVVPTKLRWIARPLRFLMGSEGPRRVMVQSLGGAVLEVP